MKVKIGNRWIGKDYPAYVIAEGGINHNGSIKIAKKIIFYAKASGADAIKFQTFRAKDLTSTKSKFFKIFNKLELDEADFGEISDYAKSQKITFFSTPFSKYAVDLLARLHVPAFKIASGDLTNIPLMKYAASKKKPMIISTGMSDIDEIRVAVRSIRSVGNQKILIMHSVSSYPTPVDAVNLLSIHYLKEKFPFLVGYSDNGKDTLVPIIAVALGAKIIEKHFTINRKLPGPDNKFSADPKDFRKMVNEIRKVEKMLGKVAKRCQLSELENRVEIRRSITAKVTIEKGWKLTENMIGLSRPATGIQPKYYSSVLGKKSRKRIKRGDSIRWNDLR